MWSDGLLHALLGWKRAWVPFLDPALPTAQGEGTLSLAGPKPKRGLPRWTEGVPRLTRAMCHLHVLRLGVRGDVKKAWYDADALLDLEPHPRELLQTLLMPRPHERIQLARRLWLARRVRVAGGHEYECHKLLRRGDGRPTAQDDRSLGRRSRNPLPLY